MKIKNDLIRIENGSKKYDFNNLILDEYLKRFVKSQLDKEKSNYIPYLRKLKCCLLKFDTPFSDLKSDSEIHNQDFDVCFTFNTYNQTINEKEIIVQYNYLGKSVWDYNQSKNVYSLDEYIGKKITAIAFNSSFISDANYDVKIPVCAILDTSNYNIYIQKNQDLVITRRDIITTDAIFYSNNKSKVPGPLHLAPYGAPQIIYQPDIYSEDGESSSSYYNEAYGILYSIGLSSYVDYIDKEYVIGTDVEVENNGTELNIKGIKEYLTNDTSFFASENVFPNASLYPIKKNYKYVILKYKVYQIVHSGTYDDVIETIKDTGYYYYQAIEIDKLGKLNMKIKYERG